MLKVEKIFESAQLPVRENPTDSGADVFVHNFKKFYTVEMEQESQLIVPEDQKHGMNMPHEAEYTIDLNDQPEEVVLGPFDRLLVGTGIKATHSKGFEIQVRPRSGLALKQGLSIVNTPGTVDESYRGEIGVILINLSGMPKVIKKGQKIAQLVVVPVELCEIKEVSSLDDTVRGDKGYGSSGT